MPRSYTVIASALLLTLTMSNALSEDLVEKAATSGTFKIFLVAAKAAGITETLKSSGPYTVFAPTDAAFEKLPPGMLDELMKDKPRLAHLLANHVIPGKLTVADVKPGKVMTIQGTSLTLTSDNGKVTVNNANVIQSDVIADNGIIHEIDAVMLPQEQAEPNDRAK